MTIKVLTIFGTRPEVIKLAPLIRELESQPDIKSLTCATTQQRDLQNGILNLFGIKPDYDLDLMKDGQDLYHITTSVLLKIKEILDRESPDYIVVQGDTTTAFSAALAGFYRKIPVVHIEAGLRTWNLYSPYPEEANRNLISRIATLHMTPTELAVHNLRQEGITANVYNVGNTIVDAVEWALNTHKPSNLQVKDVLERSGEKVLITAHRRENFGQPMIDICDAIHDICLKYPHISFIWPVHPNPNVFNLVKERLSDLSNLNLVSPLDYVDLLWVIKESKLILSDSGGIQEESCILGKNILILREDTERPEVVSSGYGVLVGSNKELICSEFDRLIERDSPDGSVVYGVPGVSRRVVDILRSHYSEGA